MRKTKGKSAPGRCDVRVHHAQGRETHDLLTSKEVQIFMRKTKGKSAPGRCDVNAHACTGGQNSRAVDIRRGTHSMQKDKRDSQFCQVRPDRTRTHRGSKLTNCRRPKRCPCHATRGEEESVSHRCDLSVHVCTGEGNSPPVDVRSGAHFMQKAERNRQFQAGAT